MWLGCWPSTAPPMPMSASPATPPGASTPHPGWPASPSRPTASHPGRDGRHRRSRRPPPGRPPPWRPGRLGRHRRPGRVGELLELLGGYVHLEDPGHVWFALAVAVSAALDGDPLWGMLIGPSSSGKTEAIRALDGLAEPVDEL